jgi:hypothetical protein
MVRGYACGMDLSPPGAEFWNFVGQFVAEAILAALFLVFSGKL